MNRTALKGRLTARIAATGPMTVAEYMATCLGDPEAGYYMSREPFGTRGDFVTAPEVSQMFGELIGAFCVQAHAALGAPARFTLAELGPGRGTLMADLLRTAKIRPEFLAAADLHLVETSPRLRKIQAKALSGAPLHPSFADSVDDLPRGPLIVVANEFFDALPIHQFVRTADGWHARCIGLDTAGRLCFGVGAARLPDGDVPAAARAAPAGTILETQPAANALAERIGARLARDGGAMLVIDYGYENTAPGDSLQALYNHAYDDVLAHPGQADITAHVNFEALAGALRSAGATPMPLLTQGDFLVRLGLLERAGALGAGKPLPAQEALRDAVERLAAPNQMGSLFKVLGASGNGIPLVPFDRPASAGEGSHL